MVLDFIPSLKTEGAEGMGEKGRKERRNEGGEIEREKGGRKEGMGGGRKALTALGESDCINI